MALAAEVAGEAVRTDTRFMAPNSRRQAAQTVEPERALYRPQTEDEENVRRAMKEADAGDFLDGTTTEAYLRWLETGEGPCPVNDESQS